MILVSLSSGPVFCLLLGVSLDYAQPITGQGTEVTCPVIGWAQPNLTPSKRQKMGPGQLCEKQIAECLCDMVKIIEEINTYW